MQKVTDTDTGRIHYRLMTPEQFTAGVAFVIANATAAEYGERSVEPRKPNPWGFYVILEEQNRTPETVTAFEAAISDA